MELDGKWRVAGTGPGRPGPLWRRGPGRRGLPAVAVDDVGHRAAPDRTEVALRPSDGNGREGLHVLGDAEGLLPLLLEHQVPDGDVRRQTQRPGGEQDVLDARIHAGALGERLETG